MTRSSPVLAVLLLAACTSQDREDVYSRVVAKHAEFAPKDELPSGTYNRIVLEVSLPPSAETPGQRRQREVLEKRRDAAQAALDVVQKKIALGLVEEPVVVPQRLQYTEAAFEKLRPGELDLVPGVEPEWTTVTESFKPPNAPRSAPCQTRQVRKVTVTVRKVARQREVAGRPEAEAAVFWADGLAQARAQLEEASRALEAVQPREVNPAEAPVLRQRVGFSLVHPPMDAETELGLHSLEGGGRCTTCATIAARNKGIVLESFGGLRFGPGSALTRALERGVEVDVRQLAFRSITDQYDRHLELPDGAKVVAKLERSCPARIVRVQATHRRMGGSGVIAVPQSEELWWHELERPSCFRDSDVGAGEEEVGAGGVGAVDTARLDADLHVATQRLVGHQLTLDRLQRGQLRQ